MPDFSIQEWNEANLTLPRCEFVDWCFEQSRWAFLSDFARAFILHKHGGIYVDADVERYIVDLVNTSRKHRQVVIGASPRGSLALLKLSRAWAAMHGRSYVLPDDVKEFAPDTLAHRIILEPSLWGSKVTESTVIDEVIRSVPVPVVPLGHE